MSTRDFFVRQFKAERPAFVKVIRALPNDKLDYKPHERNSSAGDIAWFLALELRGLVQILETGEMRWNQVPNPQNVDAIAAEYEAAADALEKALAATDDARWEEDCQPVRRRQAHQDGADRRDPLGLPVRRHPPSRPAHRLPSPDGGEGPAGLRTHGGQRGRLRPAAQFGGDLLGAELDAIARLGLGEASAAPA